MLSDRTTSGRWTSSSTQTADGRVLKLLNIVDEHTREALAVVAARRINADATAATLDRIVARRGTAPGYIRCDNGPSSRPTPCATGAGSPAPPAATSSPARRGRTLRRVVHGRLRDEFLAVEQFDSLLEAQCSSRTGGPSTTRSARIAAWAGSPRLPTPSAGRLSNTLDSHKRWTREGGPVSTASVLTSDHCHHHQHCGRCVRCTRSGRARLPPRFVVRTSVAEASRISDAQRRLSVRPNFDALRDRGRATGTARPRVAGGSIDAVSRIVASLRAVLRVRDGNIIGRTSVYLAGWRGEVRTQETNLSIRRS